MNIRVVRESGGIGDIVRVTPVLRGVREKYPEARLWVFAPDQFRCLLDGWFDEFVPTPMHKRRPRGAPLDSGRWPYLDVGVTFDHSFDLYCPAFRHEADMRGNVWLDRIDLFCRAAGVSPSIRTPELNIDSRADAAVQAYIETNGLREGKPLVALQPFSTDPARNWPLQKWIELADRLTDEGCRVVVLDCCRGRTRGFTQHRVLEHPLPFVVAFIARCDLLVGPDSGLGHVAAGVDTPCVGVFASQSGEVMYRHYPLHTWLYPRWDGQKYCRWPCFWTRGPKCARQALMQRAATCPMLARLPVAVVAAEVLARLDDVAQPIDKLGTVNKISLSAMTEAELSMLPSCGWIHELPIPARDFSYDAVALTHGTDDLAYSLREAFRVLTPAGSLYLRQADAGTARPELQQHGFSPAACTISGFVRYTKNGTYILSGRGGRSVSSRFRTARPRQELCSPALASK